MSRFDDELRHALGTAPREPLPVGMLDEALDASHRPRWPALAGAVTAAVALAIAAGIGFSELVPAPGASESPTPSAMPSNGSAASCDDVSAPAGGADIFLVYFPCGSSTDFRLASTARGTAADADVVTRLEDAVRAVLNGPTDLEQEAGLSAVVPAGSEDLLSSVRVLPDGLAEVDFTPDLLETQNLSTTALGSAFAAALRETALQFDAVTAVELRVAGSCADFFRLIGAACQHFADPLEPAGDCPIIEPAELPSGAPLTLPRAYPGEPMVSWGSGPDTVTQLAGGRAEGPELPLGGEPVQVRGFAGSVIAVEDTPDSQILIDWEEDDCPYMVWVGPDLPLEDALDFAVRFGPIVAHSSPMPVPEPVTATAEDQGIRVTITLDRDHAEYGERVYADVTVENIGDDVVHWGHSGSCPYPATVIAYQHPPEPLEYGRNDWSGDDQVLKSVAVSERHAGGYGFIPEDHLEIGAEIGCTSDFVADELAPGEALTYDAAWDGAAAHNMPARPAAHRVEATFSYLSRGEPPPVDAPADTLTVTAAVSFTVRGVDIDWVTPGEAIDILLEDAAFQALLDDAPRGRWTSQELAFDGGEWVFSLYLTETDRESEIVEAIVARLSAQTGVINSVELVQGARPPGS